MKLRHVKIRNFRCLVDVDIPIDDLTILIGENNSGKTSFLEALRIVLTRSLFGGKSIFNEFDYHMNKQSDTPETVSGIEIELTFQEDSTSEWSEELLQSLNEVIQLDVDQNLNLIILHVSSAYDTQTRSIVTNAEFLDINRQPLAGLGAKQTNKRTFSEFVKIFYLASLRNPENEFSARSQFWGQILKDLKVDQTQQKKIIKSLEKLNKDLINADQRLGQVIKTLDNAQNIMDMNSGQSTSIQALPMTPWELLSRAEVVIQSGTSKVKLPVENHGQGIQSLTVLFLFEAYIQVFLKPNFTQDTEAILALEEPEAHLHPQAIRSLSKRINQFQGQKIISTHSPYFVQEVSLSQLRFFKVSDQNTNVYYIKRSYNVDIIGNPALETFCAARPQKYRYLPSQKRLILTGKMIEDERRALLPILINQPDAQVQINELFKQSEKYLTDDELLKLQAYISRFRGDIIFSKVWLLCEGQSEFILLRYFSELAGASFDQSGVAVIDFQNNGDPEAFILLARTFNIPWFITCDNDDAGKGYIQKARGHCHAKSKIVLRPLPNEYVDLEQLMYSSFSTKYLDILSEEARIKITQAQAWTLAKTDSMCLKLLASGEYTIEEGANKYTNQSVEFPQKAEAIITCQLRRDKIHYAQKLVVHLQAQNATKADIPIFYQSIIDDITKMAGANE
jgi:putative ATP-dependent endonuclease of OLD family